MLFAFCMLAVSNVYAQKKADTASKVNIEFLNMNNFVSVKTDSGEVQKLIGNVQLKQGDSYMYCDSAYLYKKDNMLEAFNNVRIVQPGGTEAQSDFMRYTGKTKMAYMKGNVSLTDGKGKLHCEELTYDMTEKIGTYNQGGTLQNDATTVSSNSGFYNVKNKDTRFTGDVIIADPQYNIKSEDLTYNTDTKIVAFFSPSVVTSDKSVLHTSHGTYDSKNGIAHFTGRSSVVNDAQYIEADTLRYNKVTGFNYARGNVVAIDTAHHSTLYGNYAEYNLKTKRMWATGKPVLKQLNGKDSLFIRADTFYSAPIPKKDTSLAAANKTGTSKKKNKKVKTIAPVMDTVSDADSSQPRIFIGYHHVLIFSDSLQGSCDSISYTQNDSSIRMIYNPIAWSHNSQITGDTIILRLDSSKLKKLIVPNNALIVSRSGPASAQMYDQVQGRTLIANFNKNAITDMVVWPNAESIYFSKDEKNAYIGMNQAQSERMKIFFTDQKIQRIIFEQEVRQTMTPLTQVNISTSHLSRFQWLEEKRPKSKEELFK